MVRQTAYPWVAVVDCKKDKYDVYIARPSKFGNPYRIGPDGDRKEVIEKYRTWLLQQPDLMSEIADLHGKTLGCWCRPYSCHGDVILEVAEQEYNKRQLLKSSNDQV